MTSLEQKKYSRSLRTLISSDETLDIQIREKILDAANKLSNEQFKDRFKLRMLIREIKPFLNRNHVKAWKGFVGIVKLYNKRNEIKDIIL